MAERTLKENITDSISELWWLWVLQSIVAVLFGIIAIFWPALTLVTLVFLIAPFAIAIGIIEIIRSLMTVRERDTWWMSLVIGFLTLGGGIFLARNQEISFGTFVLIVGIGLIVWGVLEVARAFLDKVFTSHRTLNFIAGLASIVAGIIVLLQPVAGGVAFVWVLGIWAIAYGIVALTVALDLHKDVQAVKSLLR